MIPNDAQENSYGPTSQDYFDPEKVELMKRAAQKQGVVPWRLAFLSSTHENNVVEIVSFPYLHHGKVVANVRMKPFDPMTMDAVPADHLAVLTPEEQAKFERGLNVPFRSAE